MNYLATWPHTPTLLLVLLNLRPSNGVQAAPQVRSFAEPADPFCAQIPLPPCSLVFSPITSKPVSKIRPLCLRTNGYSSLSPAHVAEPVELEKPEENGMSSIQMRILKEKLENLGIHGETMSVPRQYNHLICPVCKGGYSEEKSLSTDILENWGCAIWCCFHGKCGWTGSTRAFVGNRLPHETSKLKKKREITEESLRLEPLCEEIVDYFSKRMISRGTLMRNAVMQKSTGDQVHDAKGKGFIFFIFILRCS